jgi:hypothetical protein
VTQTVRLSTTAILLLLAWTSPAAAQDEAPAMLGEQELRAVLDSKSFEKFIVTCMLGSPQVPTITLVLSVHEDGKAWLEDWEPETLEHKTANCLESAAHKLSFPASEFRLRLSYTFPMPGIVGRKTSLKILGAQHHPPWKTDLIAARRKVSQAGALLAVGGLFVATGTVVGGIHAADACGISCAPNRRAAAGLFLALGGVGVVMIVAGAIVLVRGKREMREAVELRDGLALVW